MTSYPRRRWWHPASTSHVALVPVALMLLLLPAVSAKKEKETEVPTVSPTLAPTFRPTLAPSMSPSSQPSVLPSVEPSSQPSSTPSVLPSQFPTTTPSPTTPSPSQVPSPTPSNTPTETPSVEEALPMMQFLFELQPRFELNELEFQDLMDGFMENFFADSKGQVSVDTDLTYESLTGQGEADVAVSWYGQQGDAPTETSIQQKLGFWGITDFAQELDDSGIQVDSLAVQVNGNTVQPSKNTVQSASRGSTQGSTNDSGGVNAALVGFLMLVAVTLLVFFTIFYLYAFHRKVASRQKSTLDDQESGTSNPSILPDHETPDAIMKGEALPSPLSPDIVSSLGDLCESVAFATGDGEQSVISSILTEGDSESLKDADPSILGPMVTGAENETASRRLSGSSNDENRLDPIICSTRDRILSMDELYQLDLT